MNVDPAGGNVSDVYAGSVQKKALDQQKVEGAQALKLLESAQPNGEARPLPPDATFSTRA